MTLNTHKQIAMYNISIIYIYYTLQSVYHILHVVLVIHFFIHY